MSDGWYYAKNGQQVGPTTDQQILSLLGSQQLSPSDLVWRDGMPQWLPAHSVPEFQSAGRGAPPPAYAPSAYSQQTAGIGYHSNYGQTPPPNYLVQAILVTIFCCLPLGVVSIVFAAQVNGKFQSGDIAGAHSTSNTAKTWAWWSFGVGLGWLVLVVGLQVLAAAAGAR